MNRMLAKQVFMRGAALRNPSLWQEYNRLKQSEWLGLEQLQQLQMERAHRFLTFAGQYSSYYREQFKAAGFELSAFDSIDELKKLPVITKDQLISENSAIHTQHTFDKTFLAETSGTSGTALEFTKNERWDSINRANMLRAYDWYGVKPWDRYGYFWGYNIAPEQAAKVKLLDYLQNRFRTFSYEKPELKAFARKLTGADYVAGYSSMVYEAARIINQLDVEKPRLKMVKGTSEMILDAYQDEISRAFGTKMISEYGAAESGLIAFECPQGNMHINMEDVIVELGEDDEIIVTNLASYSFPVIRYSLGDAVKLSDETCPCGRAHPVISEVIGRKGASVIGVQSSYPALSFYYVFKNMAIQQSILMNYKAVQQEPGRVILYIEGKDNVRHEPFLNEELTKYFSADVDFDLRFVDEFDRQRKKTQYFESKL